MRMRLRPHSVLRRPLRTLLVTAAIAALGATGSSHAQCDDWEVVSTPNFGILRNVIIDADADGGALWVLMYSKDQDGTAAPITYHVLRRESDGWVDIGLPDSSNLPSEPGWYSVAVTPGGDVWIGGDVEWHPIIDPKPAVARWRPGQGWDDPEMVEMLDSVTYPYTERSGSVGSMDIAADGTVYACGISSSLDSLQSDDATRPMLLINTGDGWLEIEDASYDWPAGGVSGNYVYEMIAFSATDAWAAGRHGTDAVGPGALITHWDGVQHIVAPTPADGGQPTAMEASGIDASAPDDIWVVGEGSFTTSETSLFMHYDGTDWTIHTSPYPESTWVPHVVVDADGSAWAHPGFGSDRRVTYFDGNAWSLRSPIMAEPPAGETYAIHELVRDGDGVLWALGTYSTGNFAMNETLAVRLDCGSPCNADLDGDASVGFVDLIMVLSNWGPCPPPCPEDLDGDGTVDFADLLALLAAWGACP